MYQTSKVILLDTVKKEALKVLIDDQKYHVVKVTSSGAYHPTYDITAQGGRTVEEEDGVEYTDIMEVLEEYEKGNHK